MAKNKWIPSYDSYIYYAYIILVHQNDIISSLITMSAFQFICEYIDLVNAFFIDYKLIPLTYNHYV